MIPSTPFLPPPGPDQGSGVPITDYAKQPINRPTSIVEDFNRHIAGQLNKVEPTPMEQIVALFGKLSDESKIDVLRDLQHMLVEHLNKEAEARAEALHRAKDLLQQATKHLFNT